MEPTAVLRRALYQLHRRSWSAWAQWHHRADFEAVRAACFFVGYPRSGHSLVGALLNAHRHAVIAHELNAPALVLAGCTRDRLFAEILARAAWFHWRGDASNYSYRVPGQWQGRFAALRVIGDKRGGAFTRALSGNPGFLDRLRHLVRVPLRLVHVVRHPHDNVAAISIEHGLRLAEAADYYFEHCRTTARLGELCDPAELVTIRHEEVIRAPREMLSSLCAFLGLDPAPEYLDACTGIVFPTPTRSRRKLLWPPDLVCEVEQRAREFDFLAGYEPFSTGDGSGVAAPGCVSRARA